MSRGGVNIFDALQRHDSDEEGHRPNKKELRAQDKLLRESQGDHVDKNPIKGKTHKGYTPSGREGKRDFDRHSGTVKQAFGNPRSKGGKNPDEKDIRYGKRRNQDGEAAQDGTEQAEVAPEIEEEEVEPEPQGITLDEYMKENNLQGGAQVDEEETNINLDKIKQLTGMKLMSKKEPINQPGVIKKNTDLKNLSQASQFAITGTDRPVHQEDRGDRDGRRGGQRGGRGRGGRGARRDDGPREPREPREGGDRRGGRGRGSPRGGNARGAPNRTPRDNAGSKLTTDDFPSL